MPCPEGSTHNKNHSDAEEKKSGESSYEKLMHSLHHDPKWLQEVNLGRRVGLYKFRCKLGCGNFSQVKLAIHQLTKERVAVKIVDKGMLDDKMMRMLNQEISTMESIHHPNLIRLYEVVETYSKLYLVMEYASGGELYNKVTTLGKLDEVVARNLFAQICSAVSHMHERQIIHRDIKAENVFFSSPNRVKLGDFGFSAQLTEGINQRLNTFCGSPPYAAPELFCDNNYVGGPVDIWALGVLLYFIVVGRMPFKGQNVPTLKANIIAGDYSIPKHVSRECAKLIEGIIQQDPLSRLTISSILSSDWLKGISIPPHPEADESYSLAPTVKKFSTTDEVSTQYSPIEETARERLLELGITSQLLDIQQSQGSRSHVIGAYRIVVHRVQKQLSSFLDVDGFWPQNEDSVEKKDLKKPNPKAEKKILAGNLISKENPKEDFFLSCWRTKASEEESYETESKNETTHARENREKQSHAKTEFVEKTKLDVWRKSPKSQSRKARGEENSTSSTPRSTTCTVL